MKYAVIAGLDQTYGYLCEDGTFTTKHPEAKLFDTREAAQTAATVDGDAEVVEVENEAEFRTRKDTW